MSILNCIEIISVFVFIQSCLKMIETRKQLAERIANHRHAKLVVTGAGLLDLHNFACDFIADTNMFRITYQGVMTFHTSKEETARAMFALADDYDLGF